MGAAADLPAAPGLFTAAHLPHRGSSQAIMLKRYKDKKVDRDWLNTNFPCMMACPAHTNAGRYVALIAEGRFEEAYRFARDPNPLASICGRVCAHPCESACRRGEIDTVSYTHLT